MLNFNSILIFSEHAKELAEFYQKVFVSKPAWADGGYTGWQVGSGHVIVGPHDKVKGKNPQPERAMINLETSDVAGEFARIKGLGAMVIKEPYHPGEAPEEWVATFADPDGNYFQLMSPMKM